MNKKYVSDIISHDEINNWKNDDIITITAGTGDGKSYFIKNKLYEHAKKNNKKILFLIHRTRCVKQFQGEIERDFKTDVIDIKTYQHIESLIKKGQSFDFSPYQYICSDEFHYFLTDHWNQTTDVSLEEILVQTNITRIFMSATGEMIKRYINKRKNLKTIDYELEIDFKFIKKLTFFNDELSMDSIIEDVIDKNEKAIIFIHSAKDAYLLHEKYKSHSIFNCSIYNDNYYKYVDEDKIESMLEEEMFNENILITTTALDAGVNIVDDSLKTIVCDVKDTTSLIQCIGRKRLKNSKDKINLYIRTINNQQLGSMKAKFNKRREMASFLFNNTPEEYVLRYKRENDRSGIVYTDIIKGESDKVTLKVNEMLYSKTLLDIIEIETMLGKKEYGYCKFLAEKFGFYDEIFNKYDYEVMEVELENKSLSERLEYIAGKKLFKEEQKMLIEMIDLKVNGRLQRSYRKLNEGLEMINLPFIIVKNIDKRRKLDDGKENPNRDKTYWMVMESLG